MSFLNGKDDWLERSTAIQITVSAGSVLAPGCNRYSDFRDRRSLAPISADELHQTYFLFRIAVSVCVVIAKTVVVSCWINLTEFPSSLCVAKISLGVVWLSLRMALGYAGLDSKGS